MLLILFNYLIIKVSVLSILILKNENLKGIEIFIKKLCLKFHFLHFFHFSRIICNKQRRRNQTLFTCVNCKLRCYVKCIGINETVKLNENQFTCSNCKPNDNSNTFTLDYLESDNVEACSKFDKLCETRSRNIPTSLCVPI